MTELDIKVPYLLFVNGATDELISAKTACGVYHWRPGNCLAQLKTDDAAIEFPLPKLSLCDAKQQGCKTLLVGVANFGGRVDPKWIPILLEALEVGLDIASGLHERIADIPVLAEAAKKFNRSIYDVRHLEIRTPFATGKKRIGKRLLTVGTDCGVGKMFTALAIENEMRRRSYNADFKATGQTGILIAGSGIPFDAMTVDFVAGAVEWLTPDNDPAHWDIIEGQGSILHPACGVVLALLHGSQPDALVMCHEASRTHLYGFPHAQVPDLSECMQANLAAAQLTNKNAKFVGVSLNTHRLDANEARRVIQQTEDRLQLPCVDPVVTGVSKIIDELERSFILGA